MIRIRPRTRTALLLLLAVAAALRLCGIGWGVPDRHRYYPYHPDELILLGVLERVHPLHGRILPSFYNYPSLYLLLSGAAIDIATQGGRLAAAVERAGPSPQWEYDRRRLLAARLVSALLAVGTVLLLLQTGRALYGWRTGWLGAVFLAVAPMHVLLAHYMAVDIPATFFFTLCFYACARALRGPQRPCSAAAPARSTPRWRSAGEWLAIGATAGLAAGTKYNAGIIALAAVVPLTCRSRTQRGAGAIGAWLGGMFLAVAAAAATFLLTTPGALFENHRFLQDLRFEWEHSRLGHGDVFRGLPEARLYHLVVTLPLALGLPLYLAGAAGCLLALSRWRAPDQLLLASIVPYYLLMTQSELRFVRYMAPLVPPLCLAAARALVVTAAGIRAIAGRRKCRRSRLRVASWVPAVLVLLGSAAPTLAHLRVLRGQDPRDAAATWLVQSTPTGAAVALATDPWFYTPPLYPAIGSVDRARLGPPERSSPQSSAVERVDLPELQVLFPAGPARSMEPLSVEGLRRIQPLRLVISDYEYADALRCRREGQVTPHAARVLELWDEVHRSYSLEKEFRIRPHLMGCTWFANETPPHDWAYFMPTLQVYRRRSPG